MAKSRANIASQLAVILSGKLETMSENSAFASKMKELGRIHHKDSALKKYGKKCARYGESRKWWYDREVTSRRRNALKVEDKSSFEEGIDDALYLNVVRALSMAIKDVQAKLHAVAWVCKDNDENDFEYGTIYYGGIEICAQSDLICLGGYEVKDAFMANQVRELHDKLYEDAFSFDCYITPDPFDDEFSGDLPLVDSEEADWDYEPSEVEQMFAEFSSCGGDTNLSAREKHQEKFNTDLEDPSFPANFGTFQAYNTVRCALAGSYQKFA